jgi:prepilin-type N-terminal cleavage/methylation domain-containing protein
MSHTGEPTAPSRDAGMSLVEVLVAMGLFSVLGTLLLGLALSTSRVTEDTRSLAGANEESRLAMERMVRELRQARDIIAVQLPASTTETTALTFWTDFDGNGVQDLNAADPEVLTYRWNPVTSRLTLTVNDASGTATTRPVLAVNVTNFVVGLRSSKWQYDRDADGMTTWQELDQSGTPVGNGDTVANDPELDHIDLIHLTMTVSQDGHAQTYTTQVDLRNRN